MVCGAYQLCCGYINRVDLAYDAVVVQMVLGKVCTDHSHAIHVRQSVSAADLGLVCRWLCRCAENDLCVVRIYVLQMCGRSTTVMA